MPGKSTGQGQKSSPNVAATNLRPYQDLLCGAVAGSVARLFIAPLDVLKIRFQVQTETRGLYRYGSVFDAARSIAQREGMQAFWKGNIPAMLMVTPYAALQFATFYQLHQSPVLQSVQQHPVRSLSFGAVAAVVATIGTYPLDLLRTRLAAQPEPKMYSGMLHAARSTYASQGIRGLYAGISPTLVEIVPYMALQYTFYEHGKAMIVNKRGTSHLSTYDTALVGAFAGTCSKLITLPLDNAKKRMQVQDQFARASRHQKYTGLGDVLVKIFRSEGIAGCFRGAVPSLLKAAPNSAITFVAYETAKRLIVAYNL